MSSPPATPLPAPTVAGTIAYAQTDVQFAGERPYTDISTVNTDGSGRKRLTWEDHPSWSPDGRKIACAQWRIEDPATLTVWVMNADGSGKVRLTKGTVHGGWPTWSPDGKRIVFYREVSPSRPGLIYVMNPDGSGMKAVGDGLEFVNNPGGAKYGGGLAWASDGRILTMRRRDVRRGGQVVGLNRTWTYEPPPVPHGGGQGFDSPAAHHRFAEKLPVG